MIVYRALTRDEARRYDVGSGLVLDALSITSEYLALSDRLTGERIDEDSHTAKMGESGLTLDKLSNVSEEPSGSDHLTIESIDKGLHTTVKMDDAMGLG